MIRKLEVCMLMLALCAAGYGATVQTYSDSTLFNSALDGTPSAQDFETLSNYNFLAAGNGFYQGITFAQPNAPTYDNQQLYVYRQNLQWFDFGTGSILSSSGEGDYLSLTFENAITALAFNFMDRMSNPARNDNPQKEFKVVFPQIDATQYSIYSLATHDVAWAGFTSTVPFTNVHIYMGGALGLDNIVFGQAKTQQPDPVSETPEVATMLMIGTGLLALRMGRRHLPNAFA